MVAQWKIINENYKNLDGYKRVAWPPVSEERIIREFTPQPQTQPSQEAHYNQQHQHQQPSATSQQYRASSYDHYSSQQQQYQRPLTNQYQQVSQQQPSSNWNQPQESNQYQQQPPFSSQNQTPYSPPPQQPNQYQQQQFINKPQYNSYSQPQQQAHLGSQDQPDQHQLKQQFPFREQSLPSDYRGGSPGIITLRKEAPVSQRPAPVYTSQPAAVSYGGGSNMRGDLKWPPQEYKEAAARENEERRKLALGPVCRPRKVNRDYTTFFAKNALNNYYPTYKVPPGTQHMLA